MIYSDIKTEFAEESDDINFKKIDGLSLYLYPELKIIKKREFLNSGNLPIIKIQKICLQDLTWLPKENSIHLEL